MEALVEALKLAENIIWGGVYNYTITKGVQLWHFMAMIVEHLEIL